MKRSAHESAVLSHLSALAWADDARTRAFVRRVAGYFGIIAATAPDIKRAAFLAEHARFHRLTRAQQRRMKARAAGR